MRAASQCVSNLFCCCEARIAVMCKVSNDQISHKCIRLSLVSSLASLINYRGSIHALRKAEPTWSFSISPSNLHSLQLDLHICQSNFICRTSCWFGFTQWLCSVTPLASFLKALKLLKRASSSFLSEPVLSSSLAASGAECCFCNGTITNGHGCTES